MNLDLLVRIDLQIILAYFSVTIKSNIKRSREHRILTVISQYNHFKTKYFKSKYSIPIKLCWRRWWLLPPPPTLPSPWDYLGHGSPMVPSQRPKGQTLISVVRDSCAPTLLKEKFEKWHSATLLTN